MSAGEPATSPTREPGPRVSRPRVTVLGVRHFGPGSARATLAALDALRPDAVLVEGPADADGIVHWAGAAGMVPPVALLGYEIAAPGNAVFWPMAAFSAEWQAIGWALSHRVPVRFMDLPSGVVLAARGSRDAPTTRRDDVESPEEPLARLAAAAGFEDVNAWWDRLIESRAGLRRPQETAPGGTTPHQGTSRQGTPCQDAPHQGAPGEGPQDTAPADPDPVAAFDELTATICELRAATPPGPDPARDQHEARREAHMRSVLRGVLRSGARNVVVVCGAWHAPALTAPLPPASADAPLLRRLPKVKTHVAWVPWSHERLAAAGGYGAGVTSPGWYHHVFTAPDHVTQRWLTRVAGALRHRDQPVSPASVVEASRLALTLADLRRRPSAGLAEVQQATVAVLCDGDPELASYITRDVVIGHALGSVPEQAPNPPLENDLQATARRLRLTREPTTRELTLDLRGDTDRARSHLLHRLAALGIDWGVRRDTTGIGTFKEGWALRWRPELSVDVVIAATYGPTVRDAAAARLSERARDAGTLADVTGVLERALLADLPDQIPGVLRRLTDRAAAEADVFALMAAIPALARSLRYGDVRDTDTQALRLTAQELLDRALAGLPSAVTSIDTDVAQQVRGHLDRLHEATGLIGPDARRRWLDRLITVAAAPGTNPLVAGRALRILHGAGRVDSAQAATTMHAALSVGAPPLTKAAWVEGFLAREGLLLAYDAALLAVLDDWVLGLGEEEFVETLPLLRRTFGSYAAPERRAVGEQVRRLHRTGDAGGVAGDADGAESDEAYDEELARGPMATMAQVLGLEET